MKTPPDHRLPQTSTDTPPAADPFWACVAASVATITEALPRCGSTSLANESRSLRENLSSLVAIMASTAAARDLAKRSIITRIVAEDAEALQQAPTPETARFYSSFADGEAIPNQDEWLALCERLERERNAVIAAIAERYLDGHNTYDDWRAMGRLARDYLTSLETP